MSKIPTRNVMTGLHSTESQKEYDKRKDKLPSEPNGLGCLFFLLILGIALLMRLCSI